MFIAVNVEKFNANLVSLSMCERIVIVD